MSRSVKNKLVELIAINLAKEKCGDPNKKWQFYVEAEDLFKHLLLRVLAEKANGGDPLQYVECLENFEEICDWDFYDLEYIETLIFGE